MMNIAIICICYNAYNDLMAFANSLLVAKKNLSEKIALTFVIVDNSIIHREQHILDKIDSLDFTTLYLKSENIGYFPGFAKGLNLLNSTLDYDYIAVANVDLTVKIDFFSTLQSMNVSENVGILAPSIFSAERGGDLNPKTLYRPTRFALEKNIFIFKRLWLLSLYKALSDLKVKNKSTTLKEGETFYSPHGSFILFTRRYFECGGTADYPQFLFGEEDFVAEECARINLKVSYQPSLKIIDSDHGSTSKEKLRFIANEHVKSLKYIVATYHSGGKR